MSQAKDPLLEIEERLTEWRKWSNPAKGVHWSEKALNDIQFLRELLKEAVDIEKEFSGSWRFETAYQRWLNKTKEALNDHG